MSKLSALPLLAVPAVQAGGANYKNFDAAVYSRVHEVNEMKDPAWLQSRWDTISKNVKIDKIYLETHRDMIAAEQATIDQASWNTRRRKRRGRRLIECLCRARRARRSRLTPWRGPRPVLHFNPGTDSGKFADCGCRRANLQDRRGDLVHVGLRPDEHVLREPDRLCAELVVLGT